MSYIKITVSLFFLLNTILVHSQETKKPRVKTEFSGHYKGDFRYFPEEGLFDKQKDSYFSTVVQPKLLLEWDDGDQLLQFTTFARLDQYNDARTHIDIRELYWQKMAKKWDLSIGVKKIFWGVTESNHLVDIINQYDMLEGIDVKHKLGQPMAHLSLALKWGIIDLIGSTYSRKLKLSGTQGRLRPPINIDYKNVLYESNQEEYNIDFAIRWSKSIKLVDIGLSHFYGNSRLPKLISSNGLNTVLYYEKIHHSSIDLQALTGAILWKMEAIYQFRENDEILAATIGGEYTISNLFSSASEITLLAEYSYDERAQEVFTGLNNDVFLGTRIAINDKQSTDITTGFVWDTELETRMYSLQFNRRLNANWKMQLDAKMFDHVNMNDLLFYNKNDSYVQATFINYF